MDEKALYNEHENLMLKELLQMEGFQKQPLGVVLVSDRDKCGVCNGNLLIRADRPSFVVIYSEQLGTINGTHFRKYCQNNCKGCSYNQHYGFHTCGSDSEVIYDKECMQLPYFMSSTATAFETKMLHRLTAEMLLGQISYRQKAEIYNYSHNYDYTTKSTVHSLCVPERSGDNAR